MYKTTNKGRSTTPASTAGLKSILKPSSSFKSKISASEAPFTENKRLSKVREELSRSFADSGLGSDEDSLHNNSRNSELSDGGQCHCPGPKCLLKSASSLSAYRQKSQSAYSTPKKVNDNGRATSLSSIRAAQSVPSSFGKQSRRYTPIVRQFVPDTPDQKKISSQSSSSGSQTRRRLVFVPELPKAVIRPFQGSSSNQSLDTAALHRPIIPISELYRKEVCRPPQPKPATFNVPPSKRQVLFEFDDPQVHTEPSPPRKKRIISTQEAEDVMYDLIRSLPAYSENRAPSPVMTMEELKKFTMERFG